LKSFLKRLVQDAVIRQLEIIGEATKDLSSSTTESYPQIPWKKFAGNSTEGFVIVQYLYFYPYIINLAIFPAL
jgi:uncharacterized protein with HEPN domain